jgi:hypothetical protein
MGLQILTAASMKMTVFWIVASYSLVEVADVSEVLAASIIRAMSEPRAMNWFETWEPVGQGRTLARPRRNSPEDSCLHAVSDCFYYKPISPTPNWFRPAVLNLLTSADPHWITTGSRGPLSHFYDLNLKIIHKKIHKQYTTNKYSNCKIFYLIHRRKNVQKSEF